MKKKASSFCYAGWNDRLKELLPFGVGVILMAIAVFAAMKRVTAVEIDIRKRSEPIAIVVASVPISAGADFHTENLASKTIPASGTGRRNVLVSDFELLIGARSKSAIEPGEPILWTDVEEPFDTDIFSKTVPEGRRALTLTVDTTSSFSGLLRPGDHIDLLAKDEKNRSKWIRGISVIATDRNINPSASPEEATETSAVTLMVTVEEGAAIAEASTGGRLFWFLRNPNDNVTVSLKNNHAAYPAVELWHAGIRVRQSSTDSNGGKSAL
ncbi:MAG: Flp pilus assembly protein CpaB [Syntrophorhabdaceae bacterium]|nr:Flp pilus assembly protein CpaB [Syntrophorhabdaceae bacterium]